MFKYRNRWEPFLFKPVQNLSKELKDNKNFKTLKKIKEQIQRQEDLPGLSFGRINILMLIYVLT